MNTLNFQNHYSVEKKKFKMEFKHLTLLLAILTTSIIATDATRVMRNNDYLYVHDYDPTPRKLPDGLLKQLMELVVAKYGHPKKKENRMTVNIQN